MSMKSWVAANRHKGGIIKYLYEKVKALDSFVGDSSSGLAKDLADLEDRVEALEEAQPSDDENP